MPFTFSHPAIVLPLTKLSPKYISASALIIGSMSPDFEYFIKMKLHQVHGHNLFGVFYFDLPVTLLCTMLFHVLVRDTLISHLPLFLRKKYAPFFQMNWLLYAKTNFIVVLYSALIGIFSHLFWDAFTHAPGYFVQFIPFLQQELIVFNVAIPAYDLMQLVSTLIGALIILIYILWPPVNLKETHDLYKTLRYAATVMLVCAIVLVLRDIQNLGDFIATSISGGFIGMMLAPFILKKRT